MRLNQLVRIAEADKNPPDVLVFAAGADYARFIPGSEGALDAVTAIMNPEKVSGRIVDAIYQSHYALREI